MFVNEVFTSPYAAAAWKWTTKGPMMWIGYFKVGEKDYKVEINGVSYGAAASLFDKPSKETFEKIFEGKDDTIYNINFTLVSKDEAGKPRFHSTPTGTGDSLIVLTTVLHMLNEFVHQMQPTVIGVWPSHWKLKNVYKGMLERMFKGWKIINAKYHFSEGFLLVSQP